MPQMLASFLQTCFTVTNMIKYNDYTDLYGEVTT